MQRLHKRKPKRVTALKFLVHLIGDLHQPLHVGNGQDMAEIPAKLFFMASAQVFTFGMKTNC